MAKLYKRKIKVFHKIRLVQFDFMPMFFFFSSSFNARWLHNDRNLYRPTVLPNHITLGENIEIYIFSSNHVFIPCRGLARNFVSKNDIRVRRIVGVCGGGITAKPQLSSNMSCNMRACKGSVRSSCSIFPVSENVSNCHHEI